MNDVSKQQREKCMFWGGFFWFLSGSFHGSLSLKLEIMILTWEESIWFWDGIKIWHDGGAAWKVNGVELFILGQAAWVCCSFPNKRDVYMNPYALNKSEQK